MHMVGVTPSILELIHYANQQLQDLMVLSEEDRLWFVGLDIS